MATAMTGPLTISLSEYINLDRIEGRRVWGGNRGSKAEGRNAKGVLVLVIFRMACGGRGGRTHGVFHSTAHGARYPLCPAAKFDTLQRANTKRIAPPALGGGYSNSLGEEWTPTGWFSDVHTLKKKGTSIQYMTDQGLLLVLSPGTAPRCCGRKGSRP